MLHEKFASLWLIVKGFGAPFHFKIECVRFVYTFNWKSRHLKFFFFQFKKKVGNHSFLMKFWIFSSDFVSYGFKKFVSELFIVHHLTSIRRFSWNCTVFKNKQQTWSIKRQPLLESIFSGSEVIKHFFFNEAFCCWIVLQD